MAALADALLVVDEKRWRPEYSCRLTRITRGVFFHDRVGVPGGISGPRLLLLLLLLFGLVCCCGRAASGGTALEFVSSVSRLLVGAGVEAILLARYAQISLLLEG